MAQSVKLSINAAVTNGPTVKGESMFDIATYGAIVEETVCKCSSSSQFCLPPFKASDIEFILVTADKFSTDQMCPPPMPGSPPPCKKCVKFSFGPDGPGTQFSLLYPRLIQGCTLTAQGVTQLSKLAVINDLTIDIKVSVLIVQKSATNACDCPTPPAAGAGAPAKAMAPSCGGLAQYVPAQQTV